MYFHASPQTRAKLEWWPSGWKNQCGLCYEEKKTEHGASENPWSERAKRLSSFQFRHLMLNAGLYYGRLIHVVAGQPVALDTNVRYRIKSLHSCLLLTLLYDPQEMTNDPLCGSANSLSSFIPTHRNRSRSVIVTVKG